ncbi:MAG TPA: cytochrome c peroxidase [Planctomycetaceae bacterium]|nr:cytochrome c peroxidase [Planctomycetaceae bacterium]HQZ68435.1 cytochrome c peroxidase [Planctomycetaceae bacterium]
MLKVSIKQTVLCAVVMLATSAYPAVAQDLAVDLGTEELALGIPGGGPLTNDQIDKWLAQAENHKTLTVKLPLGLSLGESQMKGLDKNPLTMAKIELGRQLYFDTRLSADNTVSCASCHHPQEGFARHTQFGVGIDGQKGGRNSPVSYNRILSDAQFWDGRAGSLEAQAVGPIENPIEMGNTHKAVVATLAKIPGYKKQFEKIFPDTGVTIDNVGKALAAFERILVTGPTPYDYNEAYKRFTSLDPEDLQDMKKDDPETYATYEEMKLMSEVNPMSDSALRGQDLFFSKRIGCSACHVGANLADEQYHNLGIGMSAKTPDLGRFTETKVEKDKGAFKTPTIRNVALSAPYMHDGSLATLEETVEHYNKGGDKNPWLSDKIVPLKLTPQEKIDLVEFMRACTGTFPYVSSARLPQ